MADNVAEQRQNGASGSEAEGEMAERDLEEEPALSIVEAGETNDAESAWPMDDPMIYLGFATDASSTPSGDREQQADAGGRSVQQPTPLPRPPE